MSTNHLIWGTFDIQLAMIEGSEIEALCGHRFVPSVTVGTSGRAHVPGAALCEQCDSVRDVHQKFTELREERDRLQRRMDDLNATYKLIRSGAVTREEVML